MKVLILLIFIPFSVVFAQLNVARTGVDTGAGNTGRTILRVDVDSVRPLSLEEIRLGIVTGGGLNSISIHPNSLSKYALDLGNVEEITLKDGTVLKVDEIQLKLKKDWEVKIPE